MTSLPISLRARGRPSHQSEARVTCLAGINTDRSGGQGRNRTPDTRIFSPRQSAPSSTQDHLKEPIRRKPPLVRCSWLPVGDAGLETKVETVTSEPQG